MNGPRKRGATLRRSTFAELDALVQEELDAVQPSRATPASRATARKGTESTVVDFAQANETPREPPCAAPESAPFPEEDGLLSTPDADSLFDAADREVIGRIASELRNRTNAEWILEAVRERLHPQGDDKGEESPPSGQTGDAGVADPNDSRGAP